ncbi:MAG: hypothetical protein PSV24_07125, partial [Rhodoferax sp.]|nr:hypothetical protein [Rhodoferax sp.]
MTTVRISPAFPYFGWCQRVFFASLLAWLCTVPAHANLLELTQASARITVDGVTSRQDVTLPYIWDIANAGSSGEATFELSFDLSRLPEDSWGIYLPSVGNVYEIWLNGMLLQRQGHLLAQGDDYAKVPRYVALPPGQLRASNQLRIRIHADAGRRGGLSTLSIGPQDEVVAEYQIGYLVRGTGSMVVVAFSLVVALLTLALWLTQIDTNKVGRRRRDPLYLYAAVAELCWTVAVVDALVENPLLPWPWWGAIPAAAAAGWGCNMV